MAGLAGFRSYTPLELAGLWLEGDRYRPELWLEQWIANTPGARRAGTPQETARTSLS